MALIGIFGFFLTYLFDKESAVSFRAATGILLGQVVYGFLGFIIASIVHDLTLELAWGSLLICFIFVFFISQRDNTILPNIAKDLREVHIKPASVIVACITIVFFVFTLRGVMTVRDGEIYTHTIDNYADLTLHLGIAYSFAEGKNYPPVHPDYAGTKLTYPFMSDFIAAMLYKSHSVMERVFLCRMYFLCWLYLLLCTNLALHLPEGDLLHFFQ
jgi:hypothetical protein